MAVKRISSNGVRLLLIQFAFIIALIVCRVIFFICFFYYEVHRGSYISAHVLLNLLNELEKRYKIRGLPSILSLFHNELNEFNNT